MVRRLAGFDLHETVILPENGEKLPGFAAHPGGMAVALRYLALIDSRQLVRKQQNVREFLPRGERSRQPGRVHEVALRIPAHCHARHAGHLGVGMVW